MVDDTAQAALSLAASLHIIYNHRPLSVGLIKSIEPLVDPKGKWGVFLPNEQQVNNRLSGTVKLQGSCRIGREAWRRQDVGLQTH